MMYAPKSVKIPPLEKVEPNPKHFKKVEQKVESKQEPNQNQNQNKKPKTDNNNNQNPKKIKFDDITEFMLTNAYIESNTPVHSLISLPKKEEAVLAIARPFQKVDENVSIQETAAPPRRGVISPLAPPFQKVDKKVVNYTIFKPKQKDSLFWCFYSLKHGIGGYETLTETGTMSVLYERDLKIKYVEMLRKEKKSVKAFKIASLTSLENDLANEPKIQMSTFFALCVLEKIPVYYTHKKTFFHLDWEQEDEFKKEKEKEKGHMVWPILTRHDEPFLHYSIEPEPSIEKIKSIHETFYKMVSIEKPVRVFSYYKTEDLTAICEKLELPFVALGKKKTKKDLYESIVQYF